MTLNEIKNILDARVLWGEEHLGREAASAFACDFMSDVLAYAKNQPVLITGLVNPQVVRTAEMLDVPCIIFVRGKQADETVLAMAEQRGILLMSTDKTMYLACGLLYANGLTGK